MSFSAMELMICSAARELEDGKSVAVGTGLPCAAAMLAQRTHAPNLVIMFEAGGIAPQLPTMPVSVGDSTTFHRALLATSMADVMQFCQRGMVDYTFLSGALIVMKHDAKKFVEKLDFLTTPGYLSGPGARESAGLPAKTGPHRVITDLAVMGYHEQTKRMQVLS